MDTLRIGIVGSGGMARRRAANFSKTRPCTLTAIAARNPETGPHLARKYGVDVLADWEALVERPDVDAIVICTHNETHGRIAIAALKAGKHVFTEYPAARFPEETRELHSLVRSSSAVLRTTHREPLSAAHRALNRRVKRTGGLLHALFIRLTPGRGARPEILFNLNLSGPPALFFVYHVYPAVDLFGPAAWVESGAQYANLKPTGAYDRFVNTVTVGFETGGLGQWTWAGGIEINAAEEIQRLILTGGTLIRESGAWRCSTASGEETLDLPGGPDPTLETRFVQDIREDKPGWRTDAQTAIDTARIGLAAERSAGENRRVFLSELA